jgi:pyruvate/2-oxoglutarate dehydrogenase complex dihydrolipoamide acyltransferase (E2) component
MKKTLIGLMVVGLAACDDTPKPAPKPAAPPPQAATPTPPPAPPKPEVKPEPPKADPNKELADRVKRALEGEAKIQAAGIDVTAKDGRVTLWGTTTTAAERRRAEAAAKKVEGVSGVDNQLKVVKGS